MERRQHQQHHQHHQMLDVDSEAASPSSLLSSPFNATPNSSSPTGLSASPSASMSQSLRPAFFGSEQKLHHSQPYDFKATMRQYLYTTLCIPPPVRCTKRFPFIHVRGGSMLFTALICVLVCVVSFHLFLRPVVESALTPPVLDHDIMLADLAANAMDTFRLGTVRLDAGHEHDDSIDSHHKESAGNQALLASFPSPGEFPVVPANFFLASRGMSRASLRGRIPDDVLDFVRPTIDPPKITLITSCSASFFDRLGNFIGSVHFWEPSLSIVVYDIGLTSYQRELLCCMRNVRLVSFNFDALPEHVRDLSTYAFKALLLRDALERFGPILYQDAGQELRQPLTEIISIIYQQGYFAVTQKHSLYDYTRRQTLDRLKIKPHGLLEKPSCAGGIIGFKSIDSDIVRNVLDNWVLCSLDKECIAPRGSSIGNHRFDQSVFSALIHTKGFTCFDDPRYRGDFSPPMRGMKSIVLFSRRWHCPHPYTPFVTKSTSAATQPNHHHHSNDNNHQEDDGASSLALTLQDDAQTILAWLVRYRCGEEQCLSWYGKDSEPHYTPSFHALVRKGLKRKDASARFFPDASSLESVQVDEPHSEEQFIFVKRPIVKIDAPPMPIAERNDITHCGGVNIGLSKLVPLLTVLDWAMYIETLLVTGLVILLKTKRFGSSPSLPFLNRAKLTKLVVIFGLLILLIVAFAAVSRVSKSTSL